MADVEALLLGLGTMLGIQAPPSAVLGSARRILEKSTTLLCLDNFETPWEPSTARTMVESALASISDIPKLSLILTMRGTQRPSKVAWSQPLLPPLSTLSSNSAWMILQNICPNHITDEFTLKLLNSLEGIPLAITLISNLLRDGESSRTLWTRWSTEQTGIIANGGDDRESNLNVSIALSVRSPRTTQNPGTITLLAVLSMLPDGFPLATIERLESCFQINGIHKFLQTLRAVALIKPDEPNPSPRVQMLSPIRLFCLNFLSHEISLAMEKIVDYYIGIMLDAEGKQTNPEMYVQVVPEIQNIHSVFQRAYKAGDSQDLEQLIMATTYLTEWSGYIGYLSKETIQMALNLSHHLPIPHAECLFSLGGLYRAECLFTQAAKCFNEAFVLFKYERDDIGAAHALCSLGEMLLYQRQFDQAKLAFEVSLELSTQANYKTVQAHVRRGLGEVYIYKGRYLEAETSLTSALEDYKQIEEIIGQADAAENLTRLYMTRGDPVKAERFATESLATAKQANYAHGEGMALLWLGRIYLKTDRIAASRQCFEQALVIAKQRNHPIIRLHTAADLGQIYIQSDQLGAAEALLMGSSEVKLDVIEIPTILTTLGWLYICADHIDKAKPYLKKALRLFRKFGAKHKQAEVLTHLGTVYLKSNRLDDAERMLQSIPELGTYGMVEIYRRWILGDLYIVMGKLEDAQASLTDAMSIFQDFPDYSFSYQQGNILRSIGTLHVKRGRVDDALPIFKLALEFHSKAQWISEQATDLTRLGEAYEILGKKKDAEASFKKAKAIMETVHEARTLKL